SRPAHPECERWIRRTGSRPWRARGGAAPARVRAENQKELASNFAYDVSVRAFLRCVIPAVCLSVLPGGSLEACDLIVPLASKPDPSVVRVVGRVVGHGVATRIDLGFRSTASVVLT